MIPAHLAFRFLKTVVLIEHVLADKGMLARLRRRGDQWVGPCPLHGGDNPNAFVVNRGRNIWRCFTGCDAGGDIVELVRRLGHDRYADAARYLAHIAGAPPTAAPASVTTPALRPFRPFTRRLFLDADVTFLRKKGILPATARRFEVGAFRGHGMLSGCVAVRLHDPEGRPVGYAGRRLDAQNAEQRGKWVFPSGLPRNALLYGYHRIGDRKRCVIVECPWGVLRLAQIGVPAVALLGTHVSARQLEILTRMPDLILMFDGDHAGRKAAQAVCGQLPGASVVNLPEGHDPDDLSDPQLLALLSLSNPS